MRAVWRYPILALATWGVLGIPTPARAQNAAKHSDEDNNFFELTIYGGYSDYQRTPAGLGAKIQDGVILGGRVTENFWNYVGIEESFNAYSWNKYKFLSSPPGLFLSPPFPIHTLQPSVDVVLHFTPRDHRFRPYVEAGPGASFDVLGKNAKKWGEAMPSGSGFSGFKSDERFQGNYGGGIKYQASKWAGVQIDVRGLTGIAPRFGLPTGPPTTTGVYVPGGRLLNGIQATVGLTLYLGHVGEAPPAPPPPPPPPPTARALGAINGGTISANPSTVCPGDAVNLSANSSDPEGHQLTYQWTANGSAIGSGAQYTYRPNSSGDVRIGLHVADSSDPSRGADASPVNVHVNTYNRPTVSVAANPTELDRGQMAMLRAAGNGSDCSGTLTYSWAASEGRVTGTGTNAQYDSSSVSFNDADRSRPQSKQVTVNATVTDSKGGSASASTSLTVNFGAEARHFGDILFPKDSARVNNCGKRVLIEQLYPQLASNPNYDVVLVGHIDSGEAPSGKSRRGRNLDRDRVMNTAAVLSGGGGTCSSLDTSRIKGSWIGATQESPSVPTSCAVSTTAPKERKGAAIDDTDAAKNRRVEIWLVPKGVAAPATTHNATDLPAADLKKIGCPK